MLSDELKSINAALGRLLENVDTETAYTLGLCRRNLEEAADQARNMESNFYPQMETVQCPE